MSFCVCTYFKFVGAEDHHAIARSETNASAGLPERKNVFLDCWVAVRSAVNGNLMTEKHMCYLE